MTDIEGLSSTILAITHSYKHYFIDCKTVALIFPYRLSLGEAKTPVCLQSVSKALNYALALQDRGAGDVHKFIGMEPSGRIFNELVLDMCQKPHNPMINAGAICTCSLLQEGKRPADRYEYVRNFYKRMAGYEYVGFDNAVYLSERETADRNYALAHYMRENKCFPDGTDLEETLNLYFQVCMIKIFFVIRLMIPTKIRILGAFFAKDERVIGFLIIT